MDNDIPEINELIKQFSKLPGLGPKSAKRIILKLINNKENMVKPLAKTLAQVYKRVVRCVDCGNLKVIDNAWVMLFNEEIHDSLIFKTKPSYIAKTNKDGFFNFQNLNSDIFKIVALNSFDFFYNEGEKMAFYDTTINASKDSFISLFAFDPIIIFDTTKTDTIIRLNSTLLDTSINDTIKPQDMLLGKLEILSSINSSCIIQLLQNDKLVKEAFFTKPPYIIKEIPAAKYDLKLIYDTNNDSSWTTGSWRRRAQAERVINYPSEIVIRSNWDLELEWVIEE